MHGWMHGWGGVDAWVDGWVEWSGCMGGCKGGWMGGWMVVDQGLEQYCSSSLRSSGALKLMAWVTRLRWLLSQSLSSWRTLLGMFSSAGPSSPRKQILFHFPRSFSMLRSPNMQLRKKERQSATVILHSKTSAIFSGVMAPTMSSSKLYSSCSRRRRSAMMSWMSWQFWLRCAPRGTWTQTLKLVSTITEHSSSRASRSRSANAKFHRYSLTVKCPSPSHCTSRMLSSSRKISSCCSPTSRQRRPGCASERRSTSRRILWLRVRRLQARKPLMRMEILQPSGSRRKSKFSRLSRPRPNRPMRHSRRISLSSRSSPSRLKNSRLAGWDCPGWLSSPASENGDSTYSFSRRSNCGLSVQSGFSKPCRVTMRSFSRLAMAASKRSLPSRLARCLSIPASTSRRSSDPPLVAIRRIRCCVSSSKERKRQPATTGISMSSPMIASLSPYTSRIISPIIHYTTHQTAQTTGPLQLTNMTASSTILSVKDVLARVTGHLSMRSLTAAIRTHCLLASPAHRDALLAFFLACESKLKRHSQHEWQTTIAHELRRMAALDSISKFLLRKALGVLAAASREWEGGQVEAELGAMEAELGAMEISEDVHLKTVFFCRWLGFLEERRAVRRLREKEVEDLKKARLFAQYTLKFQGLQHWKRHARDTRNDRTRTQLIQTTNHQRTALTVFAAFREKIDILAIEAQLAEAVRGRLEQVQRKAVFGRLRANQQRERKLETPLGNIWLLRFYRHLTARLTPRLTLSATRSRNAFLHAHQHLALRLAWQGLRQQTQATRLNVALVHAQRRHHALTHFAATQATRKKITHASAALRMHRKTAALRELVENVEAGNQTSLQYSEKINAVHQVQRTAAAKSFLSTFKEKVQTWSRVKSTVSLLIQQAALCSKSKALRCLAGFQARRGEYSRKQTSAESAIGLKLFLFRLQQSHARQANAHRLHGSLAAHRHRHLLALALKSFSRFRTVSLNEYDSLTRLLHSLQVRRLQDGFAQVRSQAELATKLGCLVKRSEWAALKVAFGTILHRVLSSQMRIRAHQHHQQTKLKAKLFQLLKRNSQHMLNQRNAVQMVALSFAKARLINQLKREVQDAKKQEEMESLYERNSKRRFFSLFGEAVTRRDQLMAQSEETAVMLASSRMLDFLTSSREFLEYRATEERLTYKLQKAIVRGILKTLRRRTAHRRQEKEDRLHLLHEHAEKAKAIQNERAGKCLVGLLRTKPSTLVEKTLQLKRERVCAVLNELTINQKEKSLRRELQRTRKAELVSLLRSGWEVARNSRKFIKRVRRERAKAALGILEQNTQQQAQDREERCLCFGEWLQESRIAAAQRALLSRLASSSETAYNSLLLTRTLQRSNFQRLLRQHLSQRASAIKEAIALRLYASNLKRRALRGLRRASDAQVLKENRTRIEQQSKVSAEKSMEHVRRRSKLMETIERYNHSRVSRVVR